MKRDGVLNEKSCGAKVHCLWSTTTSLLNMSLHHSNSLLLLFLWTSSTARCAPLFSHANSDMEVLELLVAPRDAGKVQDQHGLTAGLICTLVIIALLSSLSILTAIKYGFIKARRAILIHSVQQSSHVDPFAADTSYFANSSSSIGTQPAYDMTEKKSLANPFLIGFLGSPEVCPGTTDLVHADRFG